MTDVAMDDALPVATDLPPEMAPSDTSLSTDQNGEGIKALGLASVREVFSFGGGLQKTLCLVFGLLFAAVAGAVAPFMIFYFASSFQDLVADPTSDEFLEKIKELSYTFLVLGVIAFVSLSAYSTLLETAAGEMTLSLKTQWFQALLRQDLAYYDIQDVSGTATIISTNGAKYKR
jgi:ATP-binding cassette subfamily B (MDR/TAP) protein 1